MHRSSRFAVIEIVMSWFFAALTILVCVSELNRWFALTSIALLIAAHVWSRDRIRTRARQQQD